MDSQILVAYHLLNILLTQIYIFIETWQEHYSATPAFSKPKLYMLSSSEEEIKRSIADSTVGGGRRRSSGCSPEENLNAIKQFASPTDSTVDEHHAETGVREGTRSRGGRGEGRRWRTSRGSAL